MLKLCSKQGCKSLGNKKCSACGMACYCSVEYQKEDWKVHKHSCIDIKKLPTTFQPMSEIIKYAKKIHAQADILQSQGKSEETITFLQKYLEFIEHQYGVPVGGASYWRRSNGDEVDNMILIEIRMRTDDLYRAIDDPDSALVPAIEARQMLEHRDKSDGKTLVLLAQCETAISASYLLKQQENKAEYHCEQSLMFARLIKGEDRISNEYQALWLLASIRQNPSGYPDAIALYEQAYILVSEAYGPVHPQVQNAASHLIGCLILNKDYSRAYDYCRMNIDNLTNLSNGIDQESIEVAYGMKQIAEIWLAKPPVHDEEAAFAFAEEAEDMARKSCSIAVTKDTVLVVRYSVFGDVLLKRGKYTDETRMVLEQVLALTRRCSDISDTIPVRIIIEPLECLIRFHSHMGRIMSPGDARDRELQLRDEYLKELNSLFVT